MDKKYTYVGQGPLIIATAARFGGRLLWILLEDTVAAAGSTSRAHRSWSAAKIGRPRGDVHVDVDGEFPRKCICFGHCFNGAK